MCLAIISDRYTEKKKTIFYWTDILSFGKWISEKEEWSWVVRDVDNGVYLGYH